jgi:hypothetical protein
MLLFNQNDRQQCTGNVADSLPIASQVFSIHCSRHFTKRVPSKIVLPGLKFFPGHVIYFQTIRDIIANTFRKWIESLKYNSYSFPLIWRSKSLCLVLAQCLI